LSRRGRASVRCAGCRLQEALCLCAELPSIATRTRVIVLLHQLEARKTSNTGQLAHQCLPSSELHLRGNLPEAGSDRDDTRAVPTWLARAVRPVLLFPDPDAEVLGDDWRDRDPVTLIVPDGTWSQAIRARKRIKGLAQIPCVTLPADVISGHHRLRHDPRAGRVSTMEAIAHALGVLEGRAVRDGLLAVHRLAVERTLFSKGVLTADEVWGGVPPPAQPRRA
jgi:DTW domain-containing protein